MPDILHTFFIKVSPDKAFDAVSLPDSSNTWWTESCSGKPDTEEEYTLLFGPQYQWMAVVSKCSFAETFELQMQQSDNDWQYTRVGFNFLPVSGGCQVAFTIPAGRSLTSILRYLLIAGSCISDY